MLLQTTESSFASHLNILNLTEDTVVKVEHGLDLAIVVECLWAKEENVDCKVDPDEWMNFPAQIANKSTGRSDVVYAESIIAHCFGSGLLCGLENRRCRQLANLVSVLTSNDSGDVP
jgi:hypothetical protein